MDEFLQKMGEMFECILFTASLAKVSLEQNVDSILKTPLKEKIFIRLY